MKNVAIISLFLVFTISSHAELYFSGHDQGGGGEWHVINCQSYIKSSQKLSVNFCLTGDTNENGVYEIIPCKKDDTANVTVERRTFVSYGSEIVETVKIPGSLFKVNWARKKFSLTMNESIAGKFSLIKLGDAEDDQGTSLKLDLPAMKHDLKSATCRFGSN